MVSSEQEKENQCSLNKSSTCEQFFLIAYEFLMGQKISQVSSYADVAGNTKGIY